MCVCRTREWQEAVKGRCAMRAVKSLGVRLLLKFNTKTLQKEEKFRTADNPNPGSMFSYKTPTARFQLSYACDYSNSGGIASACGSQYDFISCVIPQAGAGPFMPCPRQCLEVLLLITFRRIWRKNLAERNQLFFLSDAIRKISAFFLFSNSSPAALASACGSQYDFIPCVIPQAGAGPFMPWPRQCLEVRHLITFRKIWRKNLAERNQLSESYNPFDFLSSVLLRRLSPVLVGHNTTSFLRGPASRSWAIHAVSPPMLGGQTFDYFSENLTQKPWRKESTFFPIRRNT